jgi:hypothetical protein
MPATLDYSIWSTGAFSPDLATFRIAGYPMATSAAGTAERLSGIPYS